jgi:O-methyltransferase
MSDSGLARTIGRATLLDRMYRLFWPIPTSPSPKTKDEEYKLRLVPAAAFTKKLEETLRILSAAATDPIGDYVEFGVYNGTSMGCMFDALSYLELDHVRLFGFDSFRGLPQEAGLEDGGVWHPGQFACPKEVATENLVSKGVPMSRVSLIEGWYKDTLSRPAAAYGIKKISVALIDCDTYHSARLALEFIYPALDAKSAIIFDDWKLNDLDIKEMGEYRALNEFASRHRELSLRAYRGYNRKSKIIICERGAELHSVV